MSFLYLCVALLHVPFASTVHVRMCALWQGRVALSDCLAPTKIFNQLIYAIPLLISPTYFKLL